MSHLPHHRPSCLKGAPFLKGNLLVEHRLSLLDLQPLCNFQEVDYFDLLDKKNTFSSVQKQ